MLEKKLTLNYVSRLREPRKADSHKGSYGHVLVIAGSKNMPGASVLSSYAALRSGAGLVTIAVKEDILNFVALKVRPEIMLFPYKKGKTSFTKIKNYIEEKKVTSVVIGPGLGNNEDTFFLLSKILKNLKLPVIVDADALNVLVNKIEILNDSKADVILTPHPGEFSKLTGVEIEDISKNRLKHCVMFAQKTKSVCVLKGNNTIVSDGKDSFVNTTGNPGMATAGSGDVLSGIIGALVFRVKNKSLINAACLGVYIHGLSGDIAVNNESEESLIAGDIIDNISLAFKNLIR